jgi:hypothetical protein
MPTCDVKDMAIWELQEARRYTHVAPDVSQKMLRNSMTWMLEIPNPKIDRLILNLNKAFDYMVVEPDVARGYIAGAAFELQCIREDR